jgi:hypothetical protein
MFVFRVIFGKLKEKYGEPLGLTIVFSPLIILYVFLLRPVLGPFVWLADCVIFGTPIGFFIGHIVGRKAGGAFGDAIFFPRNYLKTAPDIMSPIKGRIARREYDEAIDELNELLEEKPFSPEPYQILIEVYAIELNDNLHAMELIEEYFNQEKVYAFEENIEMLLLYSDICQEHNYLNKAQRILEQEVKRKGYPDLKRKRLEIRLEAIKENISY